VSGTAEQQRHEERATVLLLRRRRLLVACGRATKIRYRAAFSGDECSLGGAFTSCACRKSTTCPDPFERADITPTFWMAAQPRRTSLGAMDDVRSSSRHSGISAGSFRRASCRQRSGAAARRLKEARRRATGGSRRSKKRPAVRTDRIFQAARLKCTHSPTVILVRQAGTSGSALAGRRHEQD